ncbi:MAG: hypothetical protein HIU91_04305 [Acidobacteria bacterium]|nr:hypothetical protein [Acidobacteriota bacterium]
MAKRRGYPDRRGMGAQSDFIAEQFMPSEQYKTQQFARTKALHSIAIPLGQLAIELPIPLPQRSNARLKEDQPAGPATE